MRAKEIVSEIIDIIYESDCPHLHEEVVSLERGFKKKAKDVKTLKLFANELQLLIETAYEELEMDDYLRLEELILEIEEL